MKKSNVILAAALSLVLGLSAFAAEEKKDAAKDAKNLVPINKKCPVENEDVDAKEFVVYKGKKVAFCCSGCDKEFNKDPEKFMKLLADKGDDNTIKKQEKTK
jgi:YHS domain-containing protein